jgi:hypothetical protein
MFIWLRRDVVRPIITREYLYVCMYSWLQKENGNCQNKIETFLEFFHGVKPSYER